MSGGHMTFVRATHTGSWASGYPLAYSLEEGGQVHLSRIKLECFYMSVDTIPRRMRLEIVKGVLPQKRAHYICLETVKGVTPQKRCRGMLLEIVKGVVPQKRAH